MLGTELRARLLELMGEYRDAGSGGVAATTGSVADVTIYSRLTASYRKVYERATRTNASRFVTSQTFTYPANSESVSLHTVPSPSLRHRRILRFEDYTHPTCPYEIPVLSEGEFRAQGLSSQGAVVLATRQASYAGYVEGASLYLIPRPGSAVTVRAFYIPAVTPVTSENAGSWEPEFFPEEHHELLAYDAVCSFSGEFEFRDTLFSERTERERAFMAWVSEAQHTRRTTRMVW